MANRKVLINYHTSGSSAPTAANVFHGELVVAHETGKETIFTKNNANEMVPFISCAQTIEMIDSKIRNSDTDVKAALNEAHLEVETGETPGQENVFTLSTKDVQSEEEFKSYSAATNEAINGLTAVLSALTDVVITGITGDSIITATLGPTPGTTGSNEYSLAHKTATAVTGFNKLDTDAYGHVTAATPVATADIQGLGFKTSAETEEDLVALFNSATTYTDEQIDEVYASGASYVAEEIAKLDSATAVTAGKYLTGIAIADGKISGITEENLPTLSVESAGTGNVVSQITVDGHKISYTTTSVATSDDIQKLSAATIALSAGTIHDIEALSGDVIEYVKTVSGNIETVINELSAGTQADLDALSAGTIHDNEVLSADVITYINTISGYAHGEIVELSGAVQANETNIGNLSAATLDLSAVTLTGVSLNNTPLTVTDHVVSVPVTVSGDGIANATNSGSVADALAVKEYVEDTLSSAVDYKGATGATPSNPAKGDLYIASSDFVVEGSKSAETGDFIIYDGTKWDVIEKNLDGAITGNLTQDTVTLGDSTNSVKSLANGAQGTVLTIGTAGTPVWADDPVLSVVSAGTGNVVSDITVNDHEITFTKGVKAATDADLQALSGATEAISGYAASQIAALSAGTIQLSADTKAAIAELSAGTIHLSADTKATFDQLSAGTIAVYNSATSYADEAIATAIQALDSVGSASTTGHYLTSVTITDGKITAVGEEAVPAATPVTTADGGTGDVASAVLYAITPGGTDGHELTLSATNKIFSAVTSDSAITTVSAQTSVSAQTTVSANMAYELSSAATITSGQVTNIVAGIENTKVHEAESADTADKVANALSVSGYATSESSALDTAIAYDGSQPESLTFGTNGNAGLKSMSMTSAGVVDVEVIDCGTY